ncbi:dihydroxyacetone phosphate acyltransferase [Salmo salar]|uniref:Dihydroxyacetone phosphate acyltransferase n=1 Tax=Salmo salar TaxID=8030 RepID=A0A1S3M9R0_SALSA|nr:dihydroxyacetone phosphate acyltransferase [Salmo salar]|eukprot:XP_013999927.1 PREDICTED: dihydroxyacetone phosphate acyltransferase-like [Salmo salar]
MASKTLYSQRDPMLKRDGFEDILEERRNSSDLKYALRCYAPVLYKGVTPCKANMLKNIVLQSDQLHYVINQVSQESGEAPDIIQEEASVILEEMAHRLQISTVRFFAFALSKAFKTLFQHVCVNEEGIQRLQQAIQEHPVVLLPSHRSYMDFLLMSYILYTYDLALPVIAAGMDFMGMKFVGEMLRMSGAFFIRRSFGGDKLYWAVFSEYVKTMLRNGFAPIEFFLEGTRSRTCKSLTPKLGLLNIVIEPFFKGEVFDVNLVPVSISYERILEESLYARELLGVPKPKESTSGLLKARRILSEDYGSIHVYFGQPVSVRSLAQGKVNRSKYNLFPRHIPRKPMEETQSFVNDTAYRIVRLQEDNMVLKPWVLMASLLLQNLEGLELSVLTEQTLWLRGLALSYAAFLDWPDHAPTAKVVSSSLALHRGLACVSGGRVSLVVGEPLGPVTPEEALFNRAVSVLSCASYRNQVLHVFLRPAMLAVAMHTAASSRKNEVYNCFSFLWDVFSNDFILCPGDTVQDFEEACYLLVKTGAVQMPQQDIEMTDRGQPILSFFNGLLEPFLQGYQVVCRYLCEEASEGLTEKQYIPAVRSFAVKLILAGNLRCYEVLSSDMQKNALAALLRMDAVRKVKVADQVTLIVNKMAVNSIDDILGGKLPTQKAVLARL